MADTITSLITYVHGALVGDTSLKSAMGGTVTVKPSWQPPDTPKPYIVQMVGLRATDAPFPLNNGTLTLHLWDESPNATRILEMRERCVILFDASDIQTTDVISCRINLQGDDMIPDEPGIWHYVLMFSLRLYKSGEARQVLEARA